MSSYDANTPGPGSEVTIREVRSRRIASGLARTAYLRRRYDASINDVWGAFTRPERLDRWFLPVDGELRIGGRFQCEGNAGGEILRCESPRLLAVTWQYGDRAVDEVELRLSAGEAGDTILELEHATVTTSVEFNGHQVDVIRGDPDNEVPSVGTGWEMPLAYSLPRYLRGEYPDLPISQWYVPTPQDTQLTSGSIRSWAAVVDAQGSRSS